MDEPDIEILDLIQKIFSEYVLEDGEVSISRDEAAEIYRKLVEGGVIK